MVDVAGGQMSTSFGRDPIQDEVARVLGLIERGDTRGPLESKHVDLKEDAGRRGRGGEALSGEPRSESAAAHLTAAAACMANTDGGGALIVGVSDDGRPLGTQLDAEWLRGRIYDLTGRLLTVDVREVLIEGARLLVVRSPQAIEPIRSNHKITWRVDDRCVEVDAATWHARRMSLARYDWSALDSHVDAQESRPEAVALARRFLRESGETAAAELAAASERDLLRRLNVVTPDGYLTNAGVLAFVGRPDPALDYVRRSLAGGDSLRRVRDGGRSLLEEVAAVEDAVDAYNEVRQVRRGLVVGRLRDLPSGAVREAVINGVVHRDWGSAAPTLVEHVGRSLIVSSPGGFVGGVTPENIITHPSQPRNRALAELFSALRLAEREGIGVDRMVRDMISLGYPPPDIREIPGPYIRAALVGDPLDEVWIRFLGRLAPDDARSSLSVLLLLRRLVTHWWVDVAVAAPLLQLSQLEAAGALDMLAHVTVDGRPLVEPVAGVPVDAPDAWRISAGALAVLANEDAESGQVRRAPTRPAIALDWARARGRVSTTELASVVGAHATNVGSVLRGLEDQDLLRPSRESRTGPGFHYLPTEGPSAPEGS